MVVVPALIAETKLALHNALKHNVHSLRPIGLLARLLSKLVAPTRWAGTGALRRFPEKGQI